MSGCWWIDREYSLWEPFGAEPIDPRLRLKVERLDGAKRYEFEERAAILEHEGGMHRAVAENEAWREMFGEDE